ncbi:MAG: formylglycine-generating enzyme family protein [Chitinispirillales bacterium]|jgi:formylglycine-generating enzyme required for sulfatase activity|nr:formylglycine-generating enzyme family protein [Chitinispirillales bacterium]
MSKKSSYSQDEPKKNKRKLLISYLNALMIAVTAAVIIVGCGDGRASGDIIMLPAGDTVFEMVFVQRGSFKMGCTERHESDCWSFEKPAHRVTITNGFYISKYPITQAQWTAVMGANPSWFNFSRTGADMDSHPVENVSWDDVQEFILRLNEMSGKFYRLPTEAEWEFAARGGVKSRGYVYAGSNDVDKVAWWPGNSDNTTHPVGAKAANELGIYDMSGNVWEWVSDWYGNYTEKAKTNPTGPPTGSDRVIRSGSWTGGGAGGCRVSSRLRGAPDFRTGGLGFRLALSP